MTEAVKHVFGVQRRHGLSKNGGKPYDMCMLFVGKPVEPGKSNLSEVTGYGFGVEEMDADPAIIDQLKGVVFPCTATLTIDAHERNGKFYARVTGCNTKAANSPLKS